MDCVTARGAAIDRSKLYELEEDLKIELLMHIRRCAMCKSELPTRDYIETVESVVMALE